VLPAGEVHPDLVNRLAEQAAKSAQHVLMMCIRALDYCPPVDLTFGDYLRAIITADSDLVRDDDRGYRIAFIEAFRRRGIYPRDVRTLSIESLRWPGAREEENDLFKRLADRLRDFPDRAKYFATRKESYEETEKMRGKLRELLLSDLKAVRRFEEMTGLVLSPERKLPGLETDSEGRPEFEIHSLRPAQRVGPDGDLLSQLIVSITQSRRLPLDENEKLNGQEFLYRGGCTLILDLDSLNLRYRIQKSIADDQRLARQRRYRREGLGGSLRATYFADLINSGFNEPFALMHRNF
jgi:hypothetical protein